MRAAFVVGREDGARDQNALFCGLGFHRLLALEGGEAGRFRFRVGAFLFFEGGETGEGLATGGIGGGGLPLGLLGAGAGFALGQFPFAGKAFEFGRGTSGFLFGGNAGDFGCGLLGAQSSEGSLGLFGLKAGSLGGKAVSFCFRGGALTGFRFTALQVGLFDGGPLHGELLFDALAVGPVPEDPGDREQHGKNGNDEVFGHGDEVGTNPKGFGFGEKPVRGLRRRSQAPVL